jgi:hypothetical protein
MKTLLATVALFSIMICNAGATTIMDENFDSYNIKSVPSGWVLKGDGSGISSQTVDNDQYVSSPNSLKLEGGNNKSAVIDYILPKNDKITFEADIRIGQTENEGFGANIGLVDPDVGTGIRYAYVDFTGYVLDRVPHDLDMWHHVKAKVDMTNRTYDCWLDARLVDEYLTIPEDGNYKVIRLEAYKNTRVWFDNIKVYTDQRVNITSIPTISPTINATTAPTISPTITTATENTSVSENTPKTSGFEGIVAAITLFLLYILRRK